MSQSWYTDSMPAQRSKTRCLRYRTRLFQVFSVCAVNCNHSTLQSPVIIPHTIILAISTRTTTKYIYEPGRSHCVDMSSVVSAQSTSCQWSVDYQDLPIIRGFCTWWGLYLVSSRQDLWHYQRWTCSRHHSLSSDGWWHFTGLLTVKRLFELPRHERDNACC